MQVELDKVAEDFRQEHKGRQDLVRIPAPRISLSPSFVFLRPFFFMLRCPYIVYGASNVDCGFFRFLQSFQSFANPKPGIHKQQSAQLQEAVANMQRRDDTIRQRTEESAQLKEVLTARQEEVAEQQRFLQDQADENKKMEANIATLERVVSKQRTEFGTYLVARRNAQQPCGLLFLFSSLGWLFFIYVFVLFANTNSVQGICHMLTFL